MTKALEHCPTCSDITNHKTNICTVSNFIFNCKYRHLPHMHSWCNNGHEWITDTNGQNLLWRGTANAVPQGINN